MTTAPVNRVDQMKEAYTRWEEAANKKPLGEATTASGLPIKTLYTPEDLGDFDYLEKLGFPGFFPFTRGIYPSMYRGNPWTIRQYAGFGTGDDTNKLFKRLMAEGNTGLSVALDLPTQCGYDSDHEFARDEVGKVGVAIASLEDMEDIFDGIPLDKVTTSFTINGTSHILLAYYLAVAEKQGARPDRVGGTVQNDILKEFVSRGTWIHPVAPSVRLACDQIEFCSQHYPRFNPISFSSYHLAESGASELDAVAYCFSNATVYIEELLRRGLQIDGFGPRLSFNLSMDRMDIFEEVAKLRGARRLWAHIMRDRFGAKDARSMMVRLYAGVGGRSMSREEPLNNIVRVALQGLAVFLAGPQSSHMCSYDEAYAIPSDESQRIAVRTQQIIMEETGITKTVDPLGGSYFIECLTEAAEQHIRKTMDEVAEAGGMVNAIENGWIQRKLANAAYTEERKYNTGEIVMVGQNKWRDTTSAKQDFQMFQADTSVLERQLKRLASLRERRDAAAVQQALDRLHEAAVGSANTMPFLIEAAKAYATTGEITDTLKRSFGSFREPSVM